MPNATPRAAHRLKTWPQFFRAVVAGVKRFELRHDDRDYQAGDTLCLEEWDPATNVYTGAACVVRVLYVARNVPEFGLESGHCIMSITEPLR